MNVASPRGDGHPPHHTPQHAASTPVLTSRSRPSGVFWAVAAAIVVLLLGGGGYLWLDNRSSAKSVAARCKGDPQPTTIAAAPDHFPVMGELAKRWNAGSPSVRDRCVAVRVVSAEPSIIAAALGPAWNAGRDGPRPDVWAPDATAWTLVAAARPEAKPLLPPNPPSIANSAIVLALPRPMAEAMGWPRRPVRMTDLLGAMATGKTWAAFGHPEWGGIRFGMTDPTRSAAGMNMLLSILDRDADGKLSDAELTASVAFTSTVTAFAPSAAALVQQLTASGAATKALASAVAFPTDERHLATHRPTGGALDFVPVYPAGNASFADHPFVTLKAPWVDSARAETATKFRAFLLSEEGQRAYGTAGFRDAAGSATHTPLLARERGFQSNVELAKRTPDATAVNQIVAQWSLLQRPANVLVVLDTSGSMNDPVPQLGATRLQLLQQSAIKGIRLLNNRSNMCLWHFSSRLAPAADHRELVSFGPAMGRVGNVDRRQALIRAIQSLRPKGGTGLYDTAYAATRKMRQLWQPNAVNLVILITDGKNEYDKGLSRAELIRKLRSEARPDRPTPVLGIAVGPAADAAAMTEISQVTGGRTFIAKNDADALQQIILAFAGRLR
jgi:Ca-activated chloride channel family protein